MYSENILANRWLSDVDSCPTLPSFSESAEPLLWVLNSTLPSLPQEVGLIFSIVDQAATHEEAVYAYIPFRDGLELDWQSARHVINHGLISRLYEQSLDGQAAEVDLSDLRLGVALSDHYTVWFRLLANHWRQKIIYPQPAAVIADNLFDFSDK